MPPGGDPPDGICTVHAGKRDAAMTASWIHDGRGGAGAGRRILGGTDGGALTRRYGGTGGYRHDGRGMNGGRSLGGFHHGGGFTGSKSGKSRQKDEELFHGFVLRLKSRPLRAARSDHLHAPCPRFSGQNALPCRHHAWDPTPRRAKCTIFPSFCLRQSLHFFIRQSPPVHSEVSKPRRKKFRRSGIHRVSAQRTGFRLSLQHGRTFDG